MGSIFENFKNYFRYSGKTEFQTTQHNKARRTVQFERRPSQRFARRQSHVLREKQKKQDSLRVADDKTENTLLTSNLQSNIWLAKILFANFIYNIFD